MATEVASQRKGNAVVSRTKKLPKVEVRLQFKKTSKFGPVLKIAGLSSAANTRVAGAMDKAILDELSSPVVNKRVARAIASAIAVELAKQPRAQAKDDKPSGEGEFEITWGGIKIEGVKIKGKGKGKGG
jgi:hypothetical protein